MSIRLKLTLLLSVLFITAIGNVASSLFLEKTVEEKLNWVIHTHEVLNQSDKLLASMVDAETGQRGYLLTKDASYLEPFHSGVKKAIDDLKKLKHLTEDNVDQQEKLTTISVLMDSKLTELKQTVSLAIESESGYDKALKILRDNEGKSIMDNMRTLLTAFNAEELILLERRKGGFRESRAYITTLMGIEILFFVFMAVITAIFVKKNLFTPMGILLKSTAKMEKGERTSISDVLPNDEMGYLISRFYEMSEIVYEKSESLKHKAHHDELTGLKNRVEIMKEIDKSINETVEKSNKAALLFIDLNKFKQLNDTIGHDAGDAVLQETAKRLLSSVRSDDIVFRYGGDEFVVLLNSVDSSEQVKKIVDNIIKRFTQALIFQGNTIEILLSIGIVIVPDDSTSGEELLKLADIAMYAAKRDKESKYKFFDKSMMKRAGDK
jgi:diguanylate cyclase (GGDEF)-like protein